MRVLVAEDDFASRILLEAVLVKWGYEVLTAVDGEAAWNILKADNAPPIAIVDWMMPKLSGVDLCARVRERPRELVPYILMLTAKGQKSDVSEGLDAGADDYLVKPFDMQELAARMRVARRSITLQRDLVDSRIAIAYQAVHDVSTGALNRGSIISALSEAIAAGEVLTVMLLSIDGHKALQQNQGASPAEATVRAVVQQIRALMPDAVIGRYGTDELLVVQAEASLANVIELAEKAREAVADRSFAAAIGLDVDVTLSMGLAEWDGTANLELLLCYADAALYAARNVGNTIDVFSLEVEQQSAQ